MASGAKLIGNRKYSFGLISGSVSLVVESLSGLVILPMLLHFMPKPEVGIWLIMTSVTGAILLLQAAFGPIVTRVSAGWTGENKREGNIDNNQFMAIIAAYRIVLMIVLSVSVLVYILYLRFVFTAAGVALQKQLVWLLITGGFLARTYSTKNYYIVNGFGEVGWDKVVQIATTIITISGYFVVLIFGMRLLGLGVIYFSAQMIGLFLSYTVLKLKANNAFTHKKSIVDSRQLMNLLRQVGEIAILNTVGYVVMNADIYLVERFFGLSIVPFYSGLTRIGFLISSVALIGLQMAYPFIAKAWNDEDFVSACRWFKSGIRTSVLIGATLSILAFIIAPVMVPVWLGTNGYLGGKIFFWMLFYNVIYINHNAHATPVIATGANNFLIPAIVNAVMSIGLAVLFAKWIGIQGIVIGNMVGTLMPSAYVIWWSNKHFYKHACRRNYEFS